MRRQKIILIILFYAILVVPTVIYPFVKDKMDNTNYENRTLVSLKDFKGVKLIDFPSVFDSFLNDNLPFKNEFQKTRSLIKYLVFKTPSSEKVIIGDEDWLFYNSGVDGITDEVGDYEKTTRFTEQEYDIIYDNVNFVKDKLNSLGIDFYLMIPSNKSTIYSEYMPKVFVRNNDTDMSKTDELVLNLRESTDVGVIYPKDKLIENKDLVRSYYKYDTHWNRAGGFIGVTDVIKTIEGDTVNPSDYQYQSINKLFYDLSLMNQTVDLIKGSEFDVSGYFDELNPQCTEEKSKGEVIVYECFEPNAKYDKTVMLIGDSFRTSMRKHLAKTYSHVIVAYSPVVDFSYIEKYKPDTLIYEIVERNSRDWLHFADKFK